MTSYTLAGRIESGELADLYRGTRADGHSVVVKLFHPRTSDPAYARQLAQTVRQLAGVAHPGLVPVFELGLVRQRLAVISDDVAKVTLGQALNRLNTKEVLLAPGLAVAMALEMLEAMALAHAAGAVHGALTPGNVLLTGDGHTAIRDFGALKALFASQPLARQFGARGRSAYRAPENTRGDDLSVEGDLYSVGAILYTLLTLKEPSAGDGPNVSTRRGAVTPPSRVDRRLNPRLDPVVLRALDPSPSRRYRSAQDFAQGLRDFLAANGGLPARDEHKRFVGTLFPAEVNIDHLGPALFTEAFSLDEVTGADLEAPKEAGPEPEPRKPFISSEVPTQSELPMLDDRGPATQPELPKEVPPRDGLATIPIPGEPQAAERPPPAIESGQFPSWVAPAAAGPVRRAGKVEESDSGTRALEKRVRVIEDFQQLGKKPEPPRDPGGDSGPIPQPPRERLVLPTSEMLVAPEHLDPNQPKPRPKPPPAAPPRVVTEEKLIRAQAAERRQIAVWAVGFALAGAGAFYYFAAGNTGKVLPQWRSIPGAPVVKAPPFRPDLRAKDPKEPKEGTAPEKKDDPAAPKEPCYDGPSRKKAALLTVSATRGMAVRIDGVKVCGGDFTRIAIEPGKRKITVSEAGKNPQTFEAVQRFEQGKEVRVVPVFHSR